MVELKKSNSWSYFNVIFEDRFVENWFRFPKIKVFPSKMKFMIKIFPSSFNYIAEVK